MSTARAKVKGHYAFLRDDFIQHPHSDQELLERFDWFYPREGEFSLKEVTSNRPPFWLRIGPTPWLNYPPFEEDSVL